MLQFSSLVFHSSYACFKKTLILPDTKRKKLAVKKSSEPPETVQDIRLTSKPDGYYLQIGDGPCERVEAFRLEYGNTNTSGKGKAKPGQLEITTKMVVQIADVYAAAGHRVEGATGNRFRLKTEI